MAEEPNETGARAADRTAFTPLPPQPQVKHLRPVVKSEPILRDDDKGDGTSRSSMPDVLSSSSSSPTLGHADLTSDLDRRSREWASMARVLEQHRQHLEVAEREQEACYGKLARVMPVVQETAKALKNAIDERKRGQGTGDIDGLFSLSSRALDELEKAAATLATNLIWCRTAWDEYARSMEAAQRLRGDPSRANT